MPLSLDMKKILTILIMLAGLTSVLAQSKVIGSFQLEAQKDADVTRVVFETRPFDLSHHRVGVRRGRTIIDGRPAFERRSRRGRRKGLPLLLR
jgi:hypothetical protein